MAERKWTPQQKNAVYAESGTVLVSAAAGSGKTSVLVERIVRKLTDEKNAVTPDSLLVVTFTNAAAQEMRSRIFSRIAAKSAEEPERRSEYILLLSRLSEMQICTMDAFCKNLVKENSHITGIDADFRFLEEGESASLKKQAAVTVLERRFTENTDSFNRLAEMFQSGKNDAKLIETIIRLSDYSMSDTLPSRWLYETGNHFSEADAKNGIWGKYILSELKTDIDYCISLSDAAMLDIEEDEELSSKYYGLFFSENKMLKKAAENIEKGSWNEIVDTVHRLRQAVYVSKLPSVPKGYADNPSKLSAQTKRDEIKKVLTKITEYMNITRENNEDDIPVLSVVAKELISSVIEYNEVLAEMKKELNAYDFSDISHFALELLYDENASDGKTALARELTGAFSEILIDEYQDTNKAQETLFLSISKEGKNMFLVGDVKQSIYRFRLASPEIFIDKCNSFPYYDGQKEKSKIILGENFRSRKGVLDCVNFVFSSLMSRQCGEIEYGEDERLNFPSVKTDNGTVDAEFTVIETDEEKAASAEAEYIASEIARMLDEKTPVGEGSSVHSAKPSDFCILLRSPSGVAVHYMNALKEKGIAVSSDVSSGFFEASEIKTVMSYLRVIDNPMRDIDMTSVMLSPIFGFTADDIALLRLNYGRRTAIYSAVLQSAADGDRKCQLLKERIFFYRKLSVCSGVDELIREIYSDTAFIYASQARNEGEKRKNNLRKLLEKAEKSRENFSDLSGFIRYMDMLRENKADISVSAEGNGVRIMSMHKSKGLEFPFVFIAGTSKQFNKSDIRTNLIIDHEMGLGMKRKEPENVKNYDTLSSVALKKFNNNKTLSEELRVYYVALTRAKQKLFILCPMADAKKTISKALYLMRNMKEIHPYSILHANHAATWFLNCFLSHPDANCLRFSDCTVKETQSRVAVKLEGLRNSFAVYDEEAVYEADELTVKEIEERASFKYKWAEISSARSKHTASSLKDEFFDAAGFGKSVPGFMFSSSLSPADIGTVTHRFLQFCDFSACKTAPDKERDRLLAEGRFTEKQAENVDMEAIKVFVNSDIMKRIEKSNAVFREKQFTILKSICDIGNGISEEFRDEKTVVIGKIDLLFVEEGGAVIVDYKTDNVSDINVLKDRYRSQMLLYIEALEKSMGISVSECILYSLKLRDSISITF